MKGVGGQFGVTYTLTNGFNFTLLSARYTMEPINTGSPVVAVDDNKILVIQVAIKNATPNDNYFDTTGMFTASDASNQVYDVTGTPMLQSLGSGAVTLTLRPGQGLGQPSLNDPLTFNAVLPAKAKVDKLILNIGRMGKDESVIRFELKEPPKGDDKSVKNYISPLPDATIDKSDKWGNVLLSEGAGAFGTEVPSGYFHLKAEAPISPADAVFGGNPPDEGKRYVVVNVTAKSMVDSEVSQFEATGDSTGYELTDEDGERYQPIGYRKRKADEDPDHTYRKGDEYGYRVFFSVPKDAKLKKLTIGARRGYKWAMTLSN